MEIRSLPAEWASRLLDEISLTEKVRNSTLRRSTGYALGFMAILRAETQTKSSTTSFSKSILGRLVTLSLPPEELIEEAFARLGIAPIQSSVISQVNHEVRYPTFLLNTSRLASAEVLILF